MTDLNQAIKQALSETGSTIEFAVLRAFIAVESGGKWFDDKTGKILIQFEPHYFRRISGLTPSEVFRIDENGRVHFQSAPIIAPFAPANSSAPGQDGQISFDSDFIYICTGTNTWKRAALSTW